MNSLFYTTNSIDEDNNNDIESNSNGDENYIDQKEKYLFDVFPAKLNIQAKEEDDLSEEELLKINLPKDNPDCQKPFLISRYKNRGKQTEKIKKVQHLSTDFDNLQRKIQVHFFTFIINLSNDAIKAKLGSKTPYKFKQIANKLKILISQKDVNKLHKSAIKDILKKEISPKNKKCSEFINNDILIAVCQLSKLLENFFNIKYLEFFNDFYFNEEKETNKIIFEGLEIPFSKETKNFYHLLKKYENYKTLLIDSAKRIYFYGYDALVRNNSFVTCKKDIELKESDN
jgi:hypothetical protein